MKECEVCGNVDQDIPETGEVIYDIGYVCRDCLDKADNKTGYCSVQCQLWGVCDGSC